MVGHLLIIIKLKDFNVVQLLMEKLLWKNNKII